VVTGEFGSDGATARLTERAAVADLLAVLQLCGAGGLRCSEKTRRPAAATVAAVSAVLAAGDFYPDEPIAAVAWPLLIQTGGLAELAGGRLQLTARGRAALTVPPAGTIRQLWRAWIARGVIDELSRVEHIKGQRAANVLTSVKTRRQTVAAALATCPVGTWVEVDELFTRMRRSGLSPAVARSERALWRLYIADPQYGSLGYAGFHDWPLLEGRYTLAVLFEYAGTLGLLDLAYTDPAGARDDFRGNWGTDDLDYLSRYDGLRAVRLTALGGYVLGLHPAYEPPAPEAPARDSLKVLPNLDIVATGTVSAADRLALDTFAAPAGDRVWTVRADTLLAAVGSGRTGAELLGFLAERTTHELPAAVTTLVADVTARAGRLRDLGVVRLVHCAEPALAALIARDRQLRTLCQPVGEHHLAVPLDREDAFRGALHTLGYALPRYLPP
jgi:Helicase conserved C-terminal domain